MDSLRGITPIKKLSAKSIIDILLEVHDLDKCTKVFEILGYVAQGENGVLQRRNNFLAQKPSTYLLRR